MRCIRDALYCNYFQIASLMSAGVDVLFEQDGARITDFRPGWSLGERDTPCVLAQACSMPRVSH